MSLGSFLGWKSPRSALAGLEPVAVDYRIELEDGPWVYLRDEEGEDKYHVRSQAELWGALQYLPLPVLMANLKSGRINELLGHFGQKGMSQEAEFIITEREESLRLKREKPYLFELNNGSCLPKRFQAFRIGEPKEREPNPPASSPDDEYPDIGNR